MRVARGFWAMWALSLELAMGDGRKCCWTGWATDTTVVDTGDRPCQDKRRYNDCHSAPWTNTRHLHLRLQRLQGNNIPKRKKGKKKEKRMETNFHHLSSVICFPPGVSLSEWVRLFETLSTIRYIGYFSIKSPHSIFSVCKLPRETHSRTLQTALVENAELMHTIISLKRGN